MPFETLTIAIIQRQFLNHTTTTIVLEQFIDPDNIATIDYYGLLDRDLISRYLSVASGAKPFFHDTLESANTFRHQDLYGEFELCN